MRIALIPLVALALVGAAWKIGRLDGPRTETMATFRVSGGSMVPTLWGDYGLLPCRNCGLSWRVDLAGIANVPTAGPCSHCGAQLMPIDHETATNRVRLATADVVNIQESGREGLLLGDLVAVRWNDRLHLKRLVALPGDLVEVRQSRLLVNGRRVEDRLMEQGVNVPTFLVDQDANRAISRWSPTQTPSNWNRSSARRWSWDPVDDSAARKSSDWLVYGHRSVHDQNLPSPVWDDYPFNVGLDRKMNRVDRLLLRGRLQAPNKIDVEVAFWTERETLLVTKTIRSQQDFVADTFRASAADQLPVDAEHPIAIRIRGGPAELSKLRLARRIEYRLGARHSLDPYPLTITPGHCFVLGDNVPVSIDSRIFGPLPFAEVIGKVRRVAASHRGQGLW